jgi:hypothetical protein
MSRFTAERCARVNGFAVRPGALLVESDGELEEDAEEMLLSVTALALTPAESVEEPDEDAFVPPHPASKIDKTSPTATIRRSVRSMSR